MIDTFARIEIIIVTWNKKDDVVSLLGQLAAMDYPADLYHVTVVDNRSEDGTSEVLKQKFPFVNLIENTCNLGGAGGFNAGMRWVLGHAPDAEFMWLLDNDAKIEKQTLKHLVAVMRAFKDAAMCGSCIMNIDDKDEIIEAGAFIDYKKGGTRRNLFVPGRAMVKAGRDNISSNAYANVDYVAACSLLARVRAVRKTGIWHESLFIYWDDMEWGARFEKHGYRVLASRDSIVYHPSWRKRTMDNSAIWRSYYRTRNSLWFFRQYTAGMKQRLVLSRILTRAHALAFFSALQANAPLATAYVLGVKDFIRGSYGKKSLAYTNEPVDRYVRRKNTRHAAVFMTPGDDPAAAAGFVSMLKKKCPGLSVTLFCPFPRPADSGGADHLVYYKNRSGLAGILVENLKIFNALRCRTWECLITSYIPPKPGTVFGKPVVRVDFTTSQTFLIDKLSVRLLLKIAASCMAGLMVLFFKMPKIPQGPCGRAV